MGGDEATLHQIAGLNEALTLAVSLLRVAVGAVSDSEVRHGERHQSLRRQSHSAFLQRKLIIEHHFASRKSLL